MNAPVIALFIVIAMVIGAVVALAENHRTTIIESAERCVNNGGKPLRIDGTTYCLDARLFVPN